MTIYKYHFAVNTSVGFDNGEAFNTGCSGDGVSEMPMHEIEQVLENHIFLLQGKFPEGAINVGINLGICASDIGEPEEVSDVKPMPPGTYECVVAETSQNADGTVSCSFTLSEPFPSGTRYPIYSKETPDLTPGEDQRDGHQVYSDGIAAYDAAARAEKAAIREDARMMELQRREKREADREEERRKNALKALTALEPERAIHANLDQVEKVAGMISTMLGVTYANAIIIVLEMIKNEHSK